MDPNNAIEIENVRKVFHIDKSTANGFKRRNVSEKVVLDGLTLNVRKGECLGVVGRNGSGKSTTLKMMSRIIAPDSGRIEVNGKIASILELGMGFNSDFTGRENIYVKSSMFGFSRKDTDSMIDRIIEFTGLGEQIDDPVRTYSSGMNARLAFAIAVNVKCDIIILDEVLSVGDAGFRGKCANVFKQMKKEGKTIVLASHIMGTIESMCDRAVWIDNGMIREIGDPHTVSAHFEKDLTESYDTVHDLAITGDTVAMNKLGEMYRDGYKVETDLEEAERWFVKASNLGSIEAMMNQGAMLVDKGDTDGAIAIYQVAADAGNQEAQIKVMGLSGQLDDSVFEEAVKRLRELAEEGNVRAISQYAYNLLNGIAVKQDKSLAHIWFQKAAEKNDVPSIFQIGINYRDGIGVQKDADKAEKWLTLAAERGYSRAMIELANMFRKGITTNVNMEKAVYWLSRAAYSGDVNSMIQLGSIFRDGQGVEKDVSTSNMWLSLYALQNKLKSVFTLAEILRQSNKSDSFYAESIKWHTIASEKGFANSSYLLGIMYREGVGVSPDAKQALSFFKKASEQQNVNGMYEAGNMYLRGNGTEKDDNLAFEFIHKAALMGNPLARYTLGTMIRDGIGTIQDNKLALYWLELSADFGITGANMAIDRVFKDCQIDSNHSKE